MASLHFPSPCSYNSARVDGVHGLCTQKRAGFQEAACPAYPEPHVWFPANFAGFGGTNCSVLFGRCLLSQLIGKTPFPFKSRSGFLMLSCRSGLQVKADCRTIRPCGLLKQGAHHSQPLHRFSPAKEIKQISQKKSVRVSPGDSWSSSPGYVPGQEWCFGSRRSGPSGGFHRSEHRPNFSADPDCEAGHQTGL